MTPIPILQLGGAIPPVGQPTGSTTSTAATDAFGLGFEDLLQIVLTQLTYQDPLQPMENFEFVSQLAQFSQIQQSQDINDSLQTLVVAQAGSQAAALLGKEVDIQSGGPPLTGIVRAVSFGENGPVVTIETAESQTIANLPLNSIIQIRETS